MKRQTLLTLLLLSLPGLALAQDKPAEPSQNEEAVAEQAPAEEVKEPTLEDHLKEVDALYAQREPGYGGKNWQAHYDKLQALDKAHGDNFEILWRISRAYFWKSEESPNDDAKIKLGQAAWKYGDRAAAIKPNRIEGHYFAALGVGTYSEGISVISALAKGLDGKFNDRLKKALKMDGKFDVGGPYNSAGRYYFSVPWPLYDGDKAIEYFQKTLSHYPNNVRVLTYLAEVYIKEDRDAEAKTVLQKAIAMKASDYVSPPDDYRFLPKAKALLVSIKD